MIVARVSNFYLFYVYLQELHLYFNAIALSSSFTFFVIKHTYQQFLSTFH